MTSPRRPMPSSMPKNRYPLHLVGLGANRISTVPSSVDASHCRLDASKGSFGSGCVSPIFKLSAGKRPVGFRCPEAAIRQCVLPTHSGHITFSKPVSRPNSGLRTGVPISGRWRPHPIGHNPPFTCVGGRTFRCRLCPVTGRPIVKDERSFIGQSGHSRCCYSGW